MPALDSAKLASLLAEARVDLAVLFGSLASGKARPNSDVDIGILPNGAHALSVDEELRLAVMLEDVLGREVDLVRLDQASTLLRFEASRGRRLYEARPGLFADFVARALFEHDDLRPILLRCANGMFRHLRAGHDQG